MNRALVLKTILLGQVLLIILLNFNVITNTISENHLEAFDENYEEDNLNNTKIYNNFIELDENYIKKLNTRELEDEVAVLDEKIYEAKTSFEKFENGALLYSPKVIGNIVSWDIASRNRQRLLAAKKDGKRFKYDRKIVHYPKKDVRVNLVDTIDKEVLKIVHEEVKNVLENIELPDSMLKNTVVSISPFKMKGIKAFTELYGIEEEGITIVLGIDDGLYNINSKAFKEEVKSVILHELGHSFHLQNTRNYEEKNDLNNPYWKDYLDYYKEDLDFYYSDKKTRPSWKRDLRENMAEDFRIVYSDRLGKYSFSAREKRTISSYNPKIVEFLDKYKTKGIESEFVCIRYSSVKVGDENYSLYDYDTRDIENKDGLEIKLHSKEGMVCKDAYMGVWRDGKKERSDRIPIKNKEDSYLKIPKNSDINTVIKYIKVRDKYIPLWRLNIK